jgi:disulfide bond formation protein DsbB
MTFTEFAYHSRKPKNLLLLVIGALALLTDFTNIPSWLAGIPQTTVSVNLFIGGASLLSTLVLLGHCQSYVSGTRNNILYWSLAVIPAFQAAVLFDLLRPDVTIISSNVSYLHLLADVSNMVALNLTMALAYTAIIMLAVRKEA